MDKLSSALLHASCAIERLKEAMHTRQGVGARQAEWDASHAIGVLNEICNENPRFAAKQAEWEESIEMQKEDQPPVTKRPRVGDVGQEWAALAKRTLDWTKTLPNAAQTGLDSQTSTQERAKTAQDIAQPLMKDIARAVQSSAASVAGAAAAAEEAKQQPLMKQSPQPGGEAAAPQVDYTDVLDNLDRIYNSIGQAASSMISCAARNLAEEGHRIRAAQQALRCSPICEQYKTQAPPLARSGFLEGSGTPSRVMISCAYCGLTTEHSPICDNYGKSQASHS